LGEADGKAKLAPSAPIGKRIVNYQIADYSLRGGRSGNQDRVAYAERDNSVLLVLADGLGGHQGGELAAEVLVQRTIHSFRSIRRPVIEQPSAFLALSILQAHNAINAMGRAHKPPIEPRTTCVLCLVQDGYAYWAHVGDSRLYLFRDGRVRTRTRDHSVTQKLHEEGVLSEEEMKDHPEKSRLLKCVGGPHEPSIRLGKETRLHKGDTLLLCSDGLWEAMDVDEIQGFLFGGDLEDGLVDMLLEAETKMGSSSDNITAGCLRWADETTTAPSRQHGTAGEVDQAALWAQANAGRGGDTTTAPKEPLPNNKTSRSLDEEIGKLESFLDDYLSKR
jgi:serine/threonine protein phosphatase PrpC